MVTIGIPAYKGRFLRDAIASALAQDYRDIEIVVVDDHSPEDLGAILSGFSDARIRYVRNAENVGSVYPTRNWNRCLELANGEFFTLLCDDDTLDKEFVSEMLSLSHRQADAHLFRSRVFVVDEDGNPVTVSVSSAERESAVSFLWHRMKRVRVQYVSGFFCRTEELKRIGGFVEFPLAWSSDDATWCTLARNGGVASSQRPLCNWRRSAINISRQGEFLLKLDALDLFQKWLERFIDELRVDSTEEETMLNEIRRLVPEVIRTYRIDAAKSAAQGKRFGLAGYSHVLMEFRRRYHPSALQQASVLKSMIRSRAAALTEGI